MQYVVVKFIVISQRLTPRARNDRLRTVPLPQGSCQAYSRLNYQNKCNDRTKINEEKMIDINIHLCYNNIVSCKFEIYIIQVSYESQNILGWTASVGY